MAFYDLEKSEQTFTLFATARPPWQYNIETKNTKVKFLSFDLRSKARVPVRYTDRDQAPSTVEHYNMEQIINYFKINFFKKKLTNYIVDKIDFSALCKT